MSAEDLATRAPESDAQEDKPPVDKAVESSLFTGDSRVEQGPSMGEHCTTDRPTPSGELPSGEMSKMNDVDVYISRPADYPHSPSKLLLLLTGGTGVASTNNQLQSDKFAQEGFLVIMPDLFTGDPAPNTKNPPTTDDLSLIEKIKLGLIDTVKSFGIDMWLARHTPEKVLPILWKVLDAAKEEFADAVESGGGVYAVGYCFGARYALFLAGEDPEKGLWTAAQPGEHDAQSQEEEGKLPAGVKRKGPFIKAAAIAHGTQVTPDDIAGVKVPTSIICVENDPLFPDEIRTAGEDALAKSGVEHEVKVYPGVPHGFAVLGDYEDAKIKEAQKQAFGEMLGWLQAH